MSAEHLKALTERHPACRTVVFADLTLPMVLISESRVQMHREALQELCVRGRHVLTMVDGEDHDPDKACDSAIFATEAETLLFLRVPHTPTEALCCICEPAADLEAFLPAARDCLRQLSGDVA